MFYQVSTFILTGIIGMATIISIITLFVTLKINKGIYSAKNRIEHYANNPKEYLIVLQKLLQFSLKGDIFKLLIKNIYEIIKQI